MGAAGSTPAWDAIIVAGGRASRLGGIDKISLVFEGQTLIERCLSAVRGANRVSVVGYAGQLPPPPRVTRTEEQPRWSGPAASIVAGLRDLKDSPSEFTIVIAGDLPSVARAIEILLHELGSSAVDDGLVATDESGRRQPLLAVYRTESLRTAAASRTSFANLPVRQLIGSLVLREVTLPDELCWDVDTPEDAARIGIILPPARPAGA